MIIVENPQPTVHGSLLESDACVQQNKTNSN
jgi:hypothetical protein